MGNIFLVTCHIAEVSLQNALLPKLPLFGNLQQHVRLSRNEINAILVIIVHGRSCSQ